MARPTIMEGFKIVWPYYENPGMLIKQIDTLNQYSKNAQQKIEVIIIDDGSPRKPALDVVLHNPCKVQIKLWRIKENIPWNNHGARNLGAKMVGHDAWLFMTDIDHLLEPKEAEKLLTKPVMNNHFYSFERVSLPDYAKYHSHCNSFLVRRMVFWDAGGYDEDYAGSYGGDGQFLKQLKKVAPELHLKDVRIVRVPRDVIPDASTTEFARDGYYKQLFRARVQAKMNSGNTKAKNPLRFNWERQL